ncbi:hypothetical protein NEIPOLOT_00269 [Neisseria polysaccharea ATCC 43768]|nr:hypothetical protein NEIPOLOT_00269 [Neisseria polysaccharea ATCC 43768]
MPHTKKCRLKPNRLSDGISFGDLFCCGRFGYFGFNRRRFGGSLGGLLLQSLLHERMVLRDRLFFGGNFAFETVVQIETFAAARQGFQITRTAAVVGEDACNKCRIVLGQRGNQVLVDTECQRFKSFEYIVFAVDVVGNHFGLFLFAHSLDGGFQCRTQSGFLCHFGCIPLNKPVRQGGTAMLGILL